MSNVRSRWVIDFEAGWGVRYHNKFVRTLRRRQNLITFFSLVAGSGAFIAIIKSYSEFALVSSALVALLNLFGVTFQIDEHLFQHRLAANKLSDFRNRLPNSAKMDQTQIEDWSRELRQCYMAEHERNRTIEALAYNDMCSELGVEQVHRKYIFPHKRYFFPVLFSLPPQEIPNQNDVGPIARTASFGVLATIVGSIFYVGSLVLSQM